MSTSEATPVDGGVPLSARFASVNAGSVLSRVQDWLSKGAKLVPGGGDKTKDPCIGKVQDKVDAIEQKEVEKDADAQREAAIKTVSKREFTEAQKDMDETLMDCFLQAVTTRVKDRDLPIMGTTLYGKHMRMSRRIGSSCDVKDSTFVFLRPFLESLEEEGLIKLKAEVQDPTVTRINRSHPLIRNWEPWNFRDTVASQKTLGRR